MATVIVPPSTGVPAAPLAPADDEADGTTDDVALAAVVGLDAAVDVGAVVVCESEEVMRPYSTEKVWLFQSSVPYVFEALEVDLPPGRAQFNSWHNHEPLKPVEASPGHFRWELNDIPALTLRDDPSAPEWVALAGRMSVQWGDAAVEGADNQWRAIGNG